MKQLIVVFAVSLVYCLATNLHSARDLMDERRIAERERSKLNVEEMEVSKHWKDLIARKRELARDKPHSQEGRNLEERDLENYLRQEELKLMRRQSGEDCIQGDVVFVVDSSGSIGIDNWKLVLQFVNDIIKRMDVGPQKTRVALATYGNKAHIIFNLNNFTSADAMAPAVSGAKFLDENTNTSGGIYVARAIMFTEANGERPKAPNICIIITDGESTFDHDLTIPYAQEAKAQGILIISIGVGDKISKAELDGIASTGGDGRPLSLQVGSYSMLKAIQDNLARVACDPVAIQPKPCAIQAEPTTVVKNCDPVTCSNKCQYGFDSDDNNCLTCGCLPKPVQC